MDQATVVPERFYNRESELALLERLWQASDAQLVTVWGRRRVGKSALLSRVAFGKPAIYLYGTRVAERDVLTGLASAAADAFDDSYLRAAPFPSWEAALDYFAVRAESARLLLILDEFPYLCGVTVGLDTLIQRWWDRVRHRCQVMLVLAGSAFSFMEGLSGATGALHGRRTAQLQVDPFDYLDAAHFYPQLDPQDRVRAYAVFGGMPAYLPSWVPGGTLRDTVERTLLMPGHFLFREAEELLRTEFHQEALYASMLRAIALGQERPSDIARAVGKGSADEIFDHLRRLQELRLVRREVPETERFRVRTQRVLYRLADPYLRFWFRYVAPFQSLLQLGKASEVWDREIAPSLEEFIARTTWEEVCTQALWRRVAADQLNHPVAQIGRWWDGREEIDIVGLWRGQVTVVGECKWTSAKVDERVFVDLQRKARSLPLAERPLWVLASKSGFDPVVRQRAAHGDLLLLEPADLYTDGRT